jgi:hypothetical protein
MDGWMVGGREGGREGGIVRDNEGAKLEDGGRELEVARFADYLCRTKEFREKSRNQW